MSETIKVVQDGRVQELKLTPQLRGALEREGADLYTADEIELKERVEDLLYSLVSVTPRGCTTKAEVHVQETSKEVASIDHGQTQKIDEANDIVITMIRPEQFTVGWAEDQ